MFFANHPPIHEKIKSEPYLEDYNMDEDMYSDRGQDPEEEDEDPSYFPQDDVSDSG